MHVIPVLREGSLRMEFLGWLLGGVCHGICSDALALPRVKGHALRGKPIRFCTPQDT